MLILVQQIQFKIMKKLFLIFIIILLTLSYKQVTAQPGFFALFQGDYFVDAIKGNDSNSGKYPWKAWKTLTKVNATTFEPGDRIAFKSGDEWNGTITVGQSGTAGNPITFKSFGTGAKPVITGFTSVTEWTQIDDTIWESTNAVSTLTTLNMVVIGGVNTPIGRTPNTGYYYYQTTNGTTTITSSSLTGTPNWTGAEVALNNSLWETQRCPITNQSGSTLTFTRPQTFSFRGNYYFIIQNDIRTLDQQNEWYYNPSTKKLSIYSTTQPVNVKVSTQNDLVTVKDVNYVTFKNIEFEGANNNSFYLENADYVTIDNCNINYSGAVGIYGHYLEGTNLTVKNCTINQSNDGAIGVYDWHYATITDNVISNSGMIYGANRTLVGSTNGAGILYGISAVGGNTTINGNTITNTGYVAIRFNGSNTMVEENYVSNYCRVNHDGGGIYTWVGVDVYEDSVYTNTIVQNNVVINDTTTYSTVVDNGIYLDDYAMGITVRNNVVSAPEDYAFYLHNNEDCIIRDNLAYNTYGLKLYNDKFATIVYDGVEFKNNKIIAKTNTQRLMYADYPEKIIASTFVSDSNYWTRPVDEGEAFELLRRTPSYLRYVNSLEAWKIYSGEDANSLKSAYPVASSDSIFFVYNATNVTKDTTLSKTYLDVDGTAYNGTITLQPWAGVVLLDTTTYQQLLLDDMLAYWNLDQNSNTLEDNIGSNDLTNTDAVVNQTGLIGKGVVTNGSNDYLRVPYAASLMPTGNEFTINIWVKESTLTTGWLAIWRNAANENITYLRKWSSGTQAYGLVSNTVPTTFANNTNVAFTANMVTDTWYMLTLVCNGSSVKVYINGIQGIDPAAIPAFTGTLKKLTDGYIYFGGYGSGSASSYATLDEISLSGKAWTTGMIQSVYRNGTGTTHPFAEPELED